MRELLCMSSSARVRCYIFRCLTFPLAGHCLLLALLWRCLFQGQQELLHGGQFAFASNQFALIMAT